MTQNEIIRMAFDAGLMHPAQQRNELREKAVERFAALVAAHERERMWCDAEFARQQEREACAKVCDEQFQKYGCVADKCAAAIRARGEK